MSKGNTLPLSKTRSGTKKFSALTFENFKYQRFLNGFPPDIDGFFPGIYYCPLFLRITGAWALYVLLWRNSLPTSSPSFIVTRSVTTL